MNEDKKKYDLTVLISEDNKGLVVDMIEMNGGENVADVKPFTKVSLAYPVEDREQAFMVAVLFDITPSGLEELENNLKMNDKVLRYLLLKAKKSTEKSGTEKKQDNRKKDDNESKKKPFVSNKALEEKIKEME